MKNVMSAILSMFLIVGLGFAQPPDQKEAIIPLYSLERIDTSNQDLNIVETVQTVDNIQIKNYNISAVFPEVTSKQVNITILHIDPGQSNVKTAIYNVISLPQAVPYNYNNIKNRFMPTNLEK